MLIRKTQEWDRESAHFANTEVWKTEVPTGLSNEKEVEDSNFGKEYMDSLFENQEDL